MGYLKHEGNTFTKKQSVARACEKVIFLSLHAVNEGVSAV